jgi:hypothetical protein
MNRVSILLVAMILSGIVGIALWGNYNYCPSDLAFDAARWRAGDAYLRGRMAPSLFHGKILQGKTRAEVVELLGPPDEERFGGAMKYEFYLSGSHSLNWKEWLCISFDESEKVGEVEMID